ncbi:MAG: hypothetical protein ACRD7E_26645, partial [Bryobacteraceae bacterium]
APVCGVRLDHDAKWKLLQMRELRRHKRLQLINLLGLDETKAVGRIRVLRQVNLGGGGLRARESARLLSGDL